MCNENKRIGRPFFFFFFLSFLHHSLGSEHKTLTPEEQDATMNSFEKRAKAEEGREARWRRDEVPERHQAIAREVLRQREAIDLDGDAGDDAVECLYQTTLDKNGINKDQLTKAIAYVLDEGEQSEMEG